MDLLEYQGKQLFSKHGVPVPEGRHATSVAEAVEAAEELGYPVVVKAQVQIGGRGKAGGIKLAKDRAEAETHAEAILGMDIRGLTVHELYVEQASDIAEEYYAAIVFDRGAKKPMAMLSRMGGMDVEAIAEEDPTAMVKLHVDPLIGFQDFHGRRLAFDAGIAADVIRPVGAMLARLYETFVAEDAMLVEVNPLLVTGSRDVVALDAKVTLDDNALYRHPDSAEFRNISAEDPQERMAKERGLTYVSLDGNIGILGNGAGPRDVHARRGGPGGRQAGELPRRRRRLEGGGDHERRGGHPLQPAGHGRALQHLRRHHPLRRGGARPDRGLRPDRADGPVRGQARRHERRGGTAPAGRGEAPERAHRVHDARRRQPRGGAGRLMAVLVDTNTRLCVSGITGREGTFHSLNNRTYGTQVVSGVTPGKGGQDVEGIPVFDTFHQAVAETGANTAMVFVPPRFAADSILEAEDAGIELIVTITEGIPAHDELKVYNHLARNPNVRLVGPNCPGILSPGKANVGIIPASFFTEGNVGVVSRSGTLTYQIGNELAQSGFGNSSIVGIGGDPVPGSSFIDVIELFEADPETELIVLSGEIGGDAEERAADYIAEHVTKPVVAYIAGFTAPPGKTMGHAGAIVSGSAGTAQAKAEALEAKGVRVGRNPTQVAEIAIEVLGARV